MILNYLLILASLSLLSLLVVLFFQPRSLLAIATLIAPGVVYFAETDKHLIALTIDDGPNPITTPKILEILQRYGAHATFFVISNRVNGNETVVESIIRDGHELGNHLTEDKPSIQLSPSEFESELYQAHTILSRFGKIRWLRPASGWYNTAMVRTAKTYHYRVALGSIFPFDTHIPSSWFASKYILFQASPGSISVLHDTDLWGERTASTLEKVLPVLSSRGYRIVTLSELFAD